MSLDAIPALGVRGASSTGVRDLLLEPGTTCRAEIGIEQWLGEPHGTRGVLNPVYIGIEKSLGLNKWTLMGR